MALRGIQEYIARDANNIARVEDMANNIARVEDEGNIVSIEGNIFLYPPQGHPILFNYPKHKNEIHSITLLSPFDVL